MTNLDELLKKLLRDVVLFVSTASNLTLRKYQVDVARAVIDSVVHQKGNSFVVIFPRQSGKNELQVQLQVYLLTLFADQSYEMVQISPTWRPQTENAMHKLEGVLSRNLVVHDRWTKSHGHIFQVGTARLNFLSGSPNANIVGATANLLLSVDEAQDILPAKYDKEIAPMAASTNATRVFWGTAWSSNTLLAREEQAALALEEKDGIQRVWRLTCDAVAKEVPAYGKFVADQVGKLGRNHPMVRTQYYSEDIDAEGGLFPPARIALLYGTHPARSRPEPGQVYVMTLDAAGEDENSDQGGGLANPTRDSTALCLARVDFETLSDPGILLPGYQIVFFQEWVGKKHVDLYSQILAMARNFNVKYVVCDATGVGAGITAFLERSLGDKVLPFVFNARTKSDLGWSFLAMVDSGRLKTYACEANVIGRQGELNQKFTQQLEYCQYQIIPGPEKRIRWAVPDGARDPGSGEVLHDDLVICAALLSVLDGKNFSAGGPAVVVKARDPLEEMGGY